MPPDVDDPVVGAMKRALAVVLGLVVLAASGPLAMLASDQVRLGQAWYATDRSSAGLAPDPAATPEAVVQLYAARAFSWRGLFAVHTWVATKPSGADHYTVDQVTAWHRPVLDSEPRVPDRHWVGAMPRVLLDLRGPAAARAIRHIDTALSDYPFADHYRIWPGPNSNTFTAWLVRRVPELHVALPPTAIGRDYLAAGPIGPAPSGTGVQFSLFGALGVLVAKDEGVEINLFGLVWGIDPMDGAIIWPGLGRIGFDDLWRQHPERPQPNRVSTAAMKHFDRPCHDRPLQPSQNATGRAVCT